ncbi:uncharacterized protein LOC114365239 isoform X2 [Ostrinia furnacalis]|uniref:uncharacterized protein LOC114365239 isoform X2 n=1 Tax=Ostrinia furnacalis TaxID=93504 RepID=UPI00103BDF7F|nr:uncharacterized protein LOC114365239 isoform X2 [Ostrinia furnacalis]
MARFVVFLTFAVLLLVTISTATEDPTPQGDSAPTEQKKDLFATVAPYKDGSTTSDGPKTSNNTSSASTDDV